MAKRSVVSVLLAITVSSLVVAGARAGKAEKSPHAEALEMVFAQRAAEIQKLDGRDWWLDTEERTWRVKRPFGPGGFDSTHWFNVEYLIGGRSAGQWFVDTRTRTVQTVAVKDRSK